MLVIHDFAEDKSWLPAAFKAYLEQADPRQFRLLLPLQVDSQGLTDHERIVEVILLAELGQPLLQIGCRAKRDIGVLNLSHVYLLVKYRPFEIISTNTLVLFICGTGSTLQ